MNNFDVPDKRRKGICIVESGHGILLVARRRKIFFFPGGGTKKGESVKKAAIRELYEETNLKTKKINFLFEHIGDRLHNFKRKPARNHSKVFIVKTYGNPKPKNEIKYIAFWKPGSRLKITSSAKKVIEMYVNDYKHLKHKPSEKN